jgi:hypothetical protein
MVNVPGVSPKIFVKMNTRRTKLIRSIVKLFKPAYVVFLFFFVIFVEYSVYSVIIYIFLS